MYMQLVFNGFKGFREEYLGNIFWQGQALNNILQIWQKSTGTHHKLCKGKSNDLSVFF